MCGPHHMKNPLCTLGRKHYELDHPVTPSARLSFLPTSAIGLTHFRLKVAIAVSRGFAIFESQCMGFCIRHTIILHAKLFFPSVLLRTVWLKAKVGGSFSIGSTQSSNILAQNVRIQMGNTSTPQAEHVKCGLDQIRSLI